MLSHDEAGHRLYVRTLGETLLRCYERTELPSEAGAAWAVAGTRIDLAHYPGFPMKEVVPCAVHEAS